MIEVGWFLLRTGFLDTPHRSMVSFWCVHSVVISVHEINDSPVAGPAMDEVQFASVPCALTHNSKRNLLLTARMLLRFKIPFPSMTFRPRILSQRSRQYRWQICPRIARLKRNDPHRPPLRIIDPKYTSLPELTDRRQMRYQPPQRVI